MINCKEASQLLSKHLDHPLPWTKQIMLKVHVVMCSVCRLWGRQIKSLRDLIGKYTREVSDPPLREKYTLSEESKDHMKELFREKDRE
jgi:predicted anti-sigma-YlaC factor YlaD